MTKLAPPPPRKAASRPSPRPRPPRPAILTPWSAGIRMTPEEFDAAGVDRNDRHVYELVDGRVIVMPPVSEYEAGPNEHLCYLLSIYKRTYPKGSTLDLTLGERYVPHTFQRRRCDRAVWCGYGRPIDVRNDVPQIAVEFVSRGRRSHRRDYQEKREEYFRESDVTEYWIFSRFDRSLTVYRGVLDPENPTANETVVRDAERYTTPLLPGFEVSPTQVFVALDALVDEA